MIRTFKGEGKRPYKTEHNGRITHRATAEAATQKALNEVKHYAFHGETLEIEHGIWEPCETRDLTK